VFQPIQVLADALPERFRRGLGRRATGFAVALAIEALLVIVLLTLNQTAEPKKPLVTVSSFDVTPPPPAPAQPQPKSEAQTRRPTQPVPTPPQPVPPQPQAPATPPPMIVLPRDQSSFNLANLTPRQAPPAKAQAAFGPPDAGSPGDSQRVGTAPDGSALYGARWYREPTDSELAAFGARARSFGSAWGRIACKTAPDFRVDHCVIVDEYPADSHLGNAVLSAAWQFRVRPPWKNGQSLIGSWVQITIYSEPKEKPKYGK
jgi:protein TonB